MPANKPEAAEVDAARQIDLTSKGWGSGGGSTAQWENEGASGVLEENESRAKWPCAVTKGLCKKSWPPRQHPPSYMHVRLVVGCTTQYWYIIYIIFKWRCELVAFLSSCIF